MVEDRFPLRLLIRGEGGFFKLFFELGVSHAEIVLPEGITAGQERQNNKKGVEEGQLNLHVIIILKIMQ